MAFFCSFNKRMTDSICHHSCNDVAQLKPSWKTCCLLQLRENLQYRFKWFSFYCGITFNGGCRMTSGPLDKNQIDPSKFTQHTGDRYLYRRKVHCIFKETMKRKTHRDSWRQKIWWILMRPTGGRGSEEVLYYNCSVALSEWVTKGYSEENIDRLVLVSDNYHTGGILLSDSHCR